MNAENKVRVVMVEASGSDAVMSQALAEMLAPLRPKAEEAIRALPPLPIIEEPRALPPSAPAKRVKGEPVARRKAEARQARTPLKQEAVADGGRRAAIVAALAEKPMASGEVALRTGLSKPAVYSMLNILRNEGVVKSEHREGSIYPVQILVKK